MTSYMQPTEMSLDIHGIVAIGTTKVVGACHNNHKIERTIFFKHMNKPFSARPSPRSYNL